MTFQKLLVATYLVFAATVPAMAAPADIRIDDVNVFPESLGSANGIIYIGSTTKARIYRALPGQAQAEPWISKEAGDFHRILGVLADAKSNKLYVCDNDGPRGILKTFDLKTGEALKSYPYPGGGTCNDVSLKNGAAYATDTAHGRILKLAPGGSELTVWYNEPSDPSLDGLVWKGNSLFTNTYRGNHLYRIDLRPDGSAGKGAMLKTSLDLYEPDGLRLAADGRILMIEGRGVPGGGLKDGRLDEVIPNGDNAKIEVLKSGFELPVAVTPMGNTAWVLESKFDYLRNADLKGKDPGSFHVYAVPLNRTAS